MHCTACGAPVVPSQKFCTACGRALDVLPPPILGPLATPSNLPPPPPPTTAPLPPVAPHDTSWTVVEQTPTRPTDDSIWRRDVEAPTAPTAHAAPTDQTSLAASRQMAPPPTSVQPITTVRRLRPTALLIVATLSAITAIAALAVTFYSIDIDDVTVTAPRLGDVFSNNPATLIVVAVVMIGGGLASSFGFRLGAGVAGGAGLALGGFVAMQVGVVIEQFDSAGYDRIAAGGSITVTLTRDVGFWLLVAAAFGGLATFVLSVRHAGEDHRARIDPSVAVLGACAAAAVALGALIPENGVAFVRNFNDDFVPPATLYFRLGSMVLLALTGVLGFLIQRRWGLGLVLGGLAVAIVQWITTLTVDNSTATGAVPLGVSGGNLGSIEGRPHLVTTIGLVATLAFVALAFVLVSRLETRSARP
jgi:uncharacterized membrane protein